MTRVKLLWLLIPLAFLLYSCEKDDIQDQTEETQIALTEVQKNFLDKTYVSRNNPNLVGKLNPRNDEVDQIIDAFQEIPNFEIIIDNLSKKYGYPIWDKSEYNNASNGKLAFIIPLAFIDGSKTTALFVALPKNNGRYKFILERRDKILKKVVREKENYKNEEFIVPMFYHFDLELFDFEDSLVLQWYQSKEGDNLQGEELISRECYVVEVAICVRDCPVFNAQEESGIHSRNCAPGYVAVSYYDYVCTTPSGSDCANCTDGSTDGSTPTGGGSSGSSSDGTNTDTDPMNDDPNGDGSDVTDSYNSANFVFITEDWFNTLKGNGESFDDILELDNLLSSTPFFPQQTVPFHSFPSFASSIDLFQGKKP